MGHWNTENNYGVLTHRIPCTPSTVDTIANEVFYWQRWDPVEDDSQELRCFLLTAEQRPLWSSPFCRASVWLRRVSVPSCYSHLMPAAFTCISACSNAIIIYCFWAFFLPLTCLMFLCCFTAYLLMWYDTIKMGNRSWQHKTKTICANFLLNIQFLSCLSFISCLQLWGIS